MKKVLSLLMLLTAALTAQAQGQADVYQAEMDVIDAQAQQVIQQFRTLQQQDPEGKQPAVRAEVVRLSNRLDSLTQAQLELVRRIIRENHDNQIPARYIREAMYDLSYDELKAALDPTAAYYNSPELDKPKRLLAGLEKRRPGQPFHELTMKDPADRDVTLSQWAGRGNYVLVDFWASWCGPCRQEMPNVVQNYERYHGRGFEVVGVSFDQKKEAWTNAIQQLGMAWPQMSDLRGWQCAAAEAYGVFSIPSNVLLDPQGQIVATDLRGPALGEKLKEIYGE